MRPGRRPAAPWARFDDLRAGTAVQRPTPYRVLIAERPGDVLDVLTCSNRYSNAV